MKNIPLYLLCLIFLTSATWQTDFAKAKAEAAAQHKYILLKFSGSDWCIPCIKMEKRIFDQESFQDYANDKLVLVNADFPRQKKNMPDKEQVKANEALAEQYNKQGHFPYTLLLDAKGNVVKEWDGYKDATPEQFIDQIKAAINE